MRALHPHPHPPPLPGLLRVVAVVLSLLALVSLLNYLIQHPVQTIPSYNTKGRGDGNSCVCSD